MLRDAQHIAVWILEPGDENAWGRRPYPQLVLRQTLNANEFNPRACQCFDRRLYVWNFPAKHRERLRLKSLAGDTRRVVPFESNMVAKPSSCFNVNPSVPP